MSTSDPHSDQGRQQAPFGMWLEHQAGQRPDHPAIIFGDETLSYRQLAAAVAAAERWLAGNGVEPGDRVAWLGDNDPAMLQLLLASTRLGAIFVPLNSRLTVAEHAYQLGHCEPRLAVTQPHYRAHLEQAAPGSTVIEVAPSFPALGHGSGHPSAGAWSPGPGGHDPALLVYTSGTTGKPKGAIHSHGGLNHTIDNGVVDQELRADDVGLAILPLFHVGGLNIQVLPLLSVGATVVLHDRFDPGRVLADIEHHQVTISLFVPATIRAVLNHPAWPGAELGSLRGVMCGSSIIPHSLLAGFAEAGIKAGQVYGSTETGPTSLVLRLDEAHRTGSCGRPAHHASVRLSPEGEVLISGPHLFTGYWYDEAATEAAFDGPWYRTGDVGHLDDDGYYWIDDRVDDLIVSGGENVYPAEVESVLESAPGVAEVSVLGRPDDHWGQVPIVVVVAEPGVIPDLATIRHHGQQELARYKLPHDLVVVETLPRTALGKVKKHELRALLTPEA
ncbi:MAG: long-chain fatty acid--CoA ligase [Actinomycetia bacterium]|nr:long-chain fatty acid--CoA ligase [Actinomycetes bacterium]